MTIDEKQSCIATMRCLLSASRSYSNTMIAIENDDVEKIIKLIKDGGERHKGTWIERNLVNPYTFERDTEVIECSECNASIRRRAIDMKFMKYCPNCGAKMEGVKMEDEE